MDIVPPYSAPSKSLENVYSDDFYTKVENYYDSKKEAAGYVYVNGEYVQLMDVLKEKGEYKVAMTYNTDSTQSSYRFKFNN